MDNPSHADSLSPTSAKTRKPIRRWDTDNATADSPSSMAVLLDWLTESDNYRRYIGKTGNVSKQTLIQELHNRMKAHGLVHRTGADIRTKIIDLQASYAKAMDWRRNTGQGILEEHGEAGQDIINSHIRKRCRYFDVLDPVMSDRYGNSSVHVQESDNLCQPETATFMESQPNPVSPSVESVFSVSTASPTSASKRAKMDVPTMLSQLLEAQEKLGEVKVKMLAMEAESRTKTNEMHAKVYMMQARLQFIRGLKEMGFTKEEIQQQLDTIDVDPTLV